MAEKAQKDYEKLHNISKHTSVLQGISSILGWDQETFMPPGAYQNRAEQLKTLAGLIHKEKTSKKFSLALDKLIDLKNGKIKAKGLSFSQKKALEKWRRDYLKEISLPAKFVEDLAKLESESLMIWRKARKDNDFKLFAPYLDKLIQMNKKKADLRGYKNQPYDALLDDYEPEMTTKEVDALFQTAKKKIVPLLKKILKSKQVNDKFLWGSFSESKQLAFGKKILKAMGYDEHHGRLDLSTHPFSSSSHPTDSRITTRLHKTKLMSNISVVMHEGGHSLYAMGLPVEHFGSPLCESVSLGIHESQSRLWETRIGLSKPFWKFWLPELKKTFKGKLDNISLTNFYRAINKVEPTFIRVEADEVTYPLHVILRFEMEKALFDGTLKTKDIPDAWNEKSQNLLNITPKKDSDGCLQDVHWSMGAFGYFPTYALGNMYAAEFFNQFAKDHPNYEKRLEKGELAFIREWLAENVYKWGRQYTSKKLIKKVTSNEFSSKAYTDYLIGKYSKIY